VTDVPGASGKGARTGGGVVTLVIFALLIVIGVGYWFYRSMVPDRDTAAATVEEYLNLKSDGNIKRVRLNGEELTAEVAQGAFTRDGRSYARIILIVPPAYLMNPKAFAELHSGLSASEFIYTPKR
jgi:hypothetical protein